MMRRNVFRLLWALAFVPMLAFAAWWSVRERDNLVGEFLVDWWQCCRRGFL